MSDNKTRLQQAQFFADKGISVFIIEPGSKRPLEGHSWYLRQSDDREEIAGWFAQTENANFGLHLGEHFAAIDLDKKPGANGVRAFEELCCEHGVDNFLLEFDTLISETPGGGYHLFFRVPFGVANRNSFPAGIDVRGVVGYVVGPGSADSRGEWRLIDPEAEIADIPEWLLEYLEKPGYRDPNNDVPVVELDRPEDVAHAVEWLKHRDPAIQGRNGDDWTFETIQFLRDFGLSQEQMLLTMNESGWNGRCDPPWGDSELEIKIRNAWTYGQNRPGCKAPTYKVERLTSARPKGGWAHMLNDDQIAELFHPTRSHLMVIDGGRDGNTARQLEPEDDEIPEDVDDDLDPLTSESAEPENVWLDILDFTRRGRVREYVIYSWLIAHGITHLIAKRGTGKTTVALDMAFHIACDLDWCGIPTQKGWKVIYIVLEDDEGLELNCRAWMKHHSVEPERGRFMATDAPVKLTDERRLKKRLQEMVDWAAGSPCVVILDTWQRATAGASKNDQEHMERAVERAEWIASRLKGPLLSLVHPPKDGRLTVTGAGVQEDTSTGILSLEKVPDGVRLKVDRMKGPGEGAYMAFELRQIVLDGEDSFGRPLTGLVAVKTGGVEEGDKIEQARANPELAQFNALATACLDVIEDEAASAKRAGRNPHSAWHLYDVAAQLAGVHLELPGGGVYRLPMTNQRVAERIAQVFETPRRFDGGKELALVQSGEEVGGKPVRRFQLTTTDAEN